jgi:hypothetical protein
MEQRVPHRPLAVPEVQAKGLNFRGFLPAVGRICGVALVPDVIEALVDADVRDAMRYGRIVSTGWYPVAWFRALHTAAQTATYGGRDLARRIGYEAMNDDLSGVHRFVASMLAPQTLFRIGNRIFSTYWRGGCVKTVEYDSGHARAEFGGCHGFDRNLWAGIAGSCVAILEAAKARGVHVRVLEGGGDGDPEMVLDARWKV